MEPQFRAADGAGAWQNSNPPILSATPLIASLAIFAEAGLPRLRTKSVALTDFMDALVRRLEPQVHILTPRASSERGCQLSIRIAGGPTRGRAVFDALLERGVVGDWRTPDIIRVAPVPLYNRFEDVAQFAQTLGEILGQSA
jgi:kynureninase